MKRLCHIGFALVLLLSAGLSSVAAAHNFKRRDRAPVIVFVCEHGAAKSVVAAVHFNKLATARRLRIHAIARGTNPEPAIAPSAASGLKADGLQIGIKCPKKLATSEAFRAMRVVAMCELPGMYADAGCVEKWDDVPSVSEDYGKARDVLVQKIARLLDKLKSSK